jgi:hypothetical protein
MSESDLQRLVSTWVQSSPHARGVAEWLMERAAPRGCLPARLRVDRHPHVECALTSLMSERYITGKPGGARHARLDDYERNEPGEPGALIGALASALGRSVENRLAARTSLQSAVIDILSPSAAEEGLRGCFARQQLKEVASGRGRVWRRARIAGIEATSAQVERYLLLLDHAQRLLDAPGAVERLSDVSRAVAGETHWLRPGSEAWRDLSDDLGAFIQGGGSEATPRTPEERARILRSAGLLEHLTSVAVLLYGRVRLRSEQGAWSWPEEAAAQGMPVWLAAAHLEGRWMEPATSIDRIISVENETSFHDLLRCARASAGAVIVLTAGQANRAVVKALRLLKDACPEAQFKHQGDLDLAGVRILASLQARCGFPIDPEHMDAETHQELRRIASGLPLTEAEAEEVQSTHRRGDLPCRDLLAEIAATRVRFEQEDITSRFYMD